MAFYSYEFIWNSIPSSQYGLVISSINNSGVLDSPQGSEINVITKKLLRNPKEYIFGIEQSPVLEFDLEFLSENPLSAMDRSIIGSWLFGQIQYGTLQILQDDLQNISFNCVITKSSVIYIGNLARGWKAHIRCDSPFGWDIPQVYSWNYLVGTFSDTVTIVNNSHDAYYTYPTISITQNALAGHVTFTNITDSNRLFDINMIANYTFVFDNQRQLITTTPTYPNPISLFNLKWFRLLPGANSVNIVGNMSAFSITIPQARKVGG